MKNKLGLIAFCLVGFVAQSVDATIRLVSFENDSWIRFNETTDEGRPYLDLINEGSGFVIDGEGSAISSKNGKYKIRFEDAGRSGFHRPHWKFHVWVEAEKGFPLLEGSEVLHSVFFYDGEGEMSVKLSEEGKLVIEGGRAVLNPWKEGKIGRGTPYHTIDHDLQDENGVAYFDHDGFIGLPYNHFAECEEKVVEGMARYEQFSPESGS